ncbi:MAG: leucyl aminopeptidase [Planctomycetota bacterium]
MQHTIEHRSAAESRDAFLALILPKGDGALEGEAAALNDAVGGLIARVRESGEFTGKARETVLLHNGNDAGPERLLLVGLGEEKHHDAEGLRIAGAAAARATRKAKSSSLAMVLPSLDGVPAAEAVVALIEGATLATYEYVDHKTGDAATVSNPVESMVLVNASGGEGASLEESVHLGSILARSGWMARDIANTPGNEGTPTFLAERAKEIADAHGMKLTVLEREDMERDGFGGVLGVARGTDEPPKFIVLEHGAEHSDGPTICLVGKGITFDTGGISIKPSAAMHEMKFDKCGAVAVIATMKAVGELGLKLHIVGITPCTENMPGGSAYKPGDVIHSLGGKTVEVLNTDAEGRMCLIDAITYSRRFEPDVVIDLATLTGACVVALGDAASGLFSTDEGLAEDLQAAARVSGERVWRMPLYDDYTDQIRSDVADYKNTGGRWAGACTAAALLQAHAEGLTWAHLDIAGTSWGDKDKDYKRKGATGFGPRLLVRYLMARAGG